MRCEVSISQDNRACEIVWQLTSVHAFERVSSPIDSRGSLVHLNATSQNPRTFCLISEVKKSST